MDELRAQLSDGVFAELLPLAGDVIDVDTTVPEDVDVPALVAAVRARVGGRTE